MLEEATETTYITPKGMVKLTTELSDLKKIRREIIERLLENLSDNIEYDKVVYQSARDELEIVNGRIRELEYILRHAEWKLPSKGVAALNKIIW